MNTTTAAKFVKVAGPQTYEVTVGDITYTVRKLGHLWEALDKDGELVAYGTSRESVAKKLVR